jgi:uncharacterized protein YdeI (YjbR/CyaY-like superfamily)
MSDQTTSVPDDLSQALRAAPQAQTRFDTLPPSHREEYLSWIAEAKKPDTRARRVAKTIELLSIAG